MDYLDDLTTEAKLCQAVNTVKNVNGKLIGHISDGKEWARNYREIKIALGMDE